MNTAFIALGSNLANPVSQIMNALERMHECELIVALTCSSFYTNQALGPELQPDYVNAVARINTPMDPHELLLFLQAIEHDHGRIRSNQRWSPRTLDLDIILFNQISMESPALIIPHPRLHERSFVVLPLLEIDPDVCMPDGTPLKKLADTLTSHPLIKLNILHTFCDH